MKAVTTLAACFAMMGQATLAQQPAQSPPQEDFAAAMARANRVPDTAGDGPYPAMMEVDPALPDYVVYRPADLAPFAGGELGLFVWGNGGCAADGSSQRQHLAEIASYGYLVIAPGKWRSGPNAKDPPSTPRPAGANPMSLASPTSAADLTRALDWALAESGRQGSKYSGLIDPEAVAAGGFSCGGVQALTIAGDARLATVVVQNSGLVPEPGNSPSAMNLPKSALSALHTPVLYLDGGPTDIAYENGMDDFSRIANVPAVMVNTPTGHGGTYHEPMGGKNAGIVVDWLQWQLRGDASAARTFVGANCRLCTDSGATIERKNF